MKIKFKYTVEFEEIEECSDDANLDSLKNDEINGFKNSKENIIFDLIDYNDYEKIEVTKYEYEIMKD